jgi:hypothetical protein
MAIPQITLDDLAWADLTAAARQRIPAASNGRWTLHAPVDPGITLLELHAWLLEQRLYWMDHVPDSLSRGALALLGEAARDAACATAVLHFATDKPGLVTAGTLMQLRDSDPPLVLATEGPVTLLPLATATMFRPRIDVTVDGVNRANDLAAGRDLCVLRWAGDEVEITLWMSQPLAAPAAGDALMLLVMLDHSEIHVPVQWSVDAVSGIAPPASVSWWYGSGPEGRRTQFATGSVTDGTGGIRRSGIVRLALPRDWVPGPKNTDEPYPYKLWLRADTAGFSAPPRLAGLWPNVAVATHRQSLRVRQDLDWLPLPGNVIKLAPEQQPVLSAGTRIRLMERDGKLHWWLPTPDLTFHGREDRVFVADRLAGNLVFGNGETGRIPLPGSGFALRDVADAAGLATAWKSGDPVSAYLVSLLSPAAAAQIGAYVAKAAPSRPLLRALLEGLNAAVAAAGLYEESRFAGIALRDATRALLNQKPPGYPLSAPQQERLNRLLLEDAYPNFVTRGAAELRLRIGGGIAGNVAGALVWEAFGNSVAPQAVNPVPCDGGADPESLADARQRATEDLRRVDRAVIAADFEELATTTPGVAIRRAHAAVGLHPDFPCLPVPGAVTVFIIPAVFREDGAIPCSDVPAPVPDAGASAAVAARLDSARLIGTEVFVLPPLYQPVALTIDLEAHTAAPDALRTIVERQFRRFLDPLIGGEDKAGWPFGEKLRPSILLRQAQDAIGFQGDVRRVGITLLDTITPEESCNDVPIGPHALPTLKSVVTRVTAAPAETTGGLS